jgi:hypothetical protein
MPLHRGAFCQFPFQWIYFYGSNKSTRKKTDKMHLCALFKFFYFFLGRLSDKVTITYNGQFICETDDYLDAIEAHLIQFSLLYAFDVSFETDEKGAKFGDNIRYFFEFLTVYIELVKK